MRDELSVVSNADQKLLLVYSLGVSEECKFWFP